MHYDVQYGIERRMYLCLHSEWSFGNLSKWRVHDVLRYPSSLYNRRRLFVMTVIHLHEYDIQTQKCWIYATSSC